MTLFRSTTALAPLAMSLAALLSAPTANAQTETSGPAVSTVVTVEPKGKTPAPPIPVSSLQVKVDNKTVQPVDWHPYGNGEVQLVILIDSSARTSIGRNLSEVNDFIQSLPPNVAVGLAYMQNGASVFATPLSTDHAAAAKGLHLPVGNPGSSASPYFCIQDLAKRWPAPPSAARREVLMITDGVDLYNLRYDPQDPYVLAAINDANKAHMLLFPIYWRNEGRLSRTFYETNAGQNYLFQVADATGGYVYYQGLMNPVSFVPFFEDFSQRLKNQYELTVPVKPEKKVSYARLGVKTDVGGGVKVKAAGSIAVPPMDNGEPQ